MHSSSVLCLFSLVTTMISLYCCHNFPSQIMENILIDGRHFSKRTIMILCTGVREQQLKMAEVLLLWREEWNLEQ